MTLGKRISIGFATLVFITLVLGIIGVINMRSAATDATKLSDVYAPEVQVASEVFKYAGAARYDIRAFTMQDSEESLASAKKNFAELQKQLAVAQNLGKKYDLKALLENEAKASKALVEYIASVERSEKILVRKKSFAKAMEENAAVFMKNADDYLKSQEVALVKEMETKVEQSKLVERLGKITRINTVIDLGNEARIAGQKAQVNRDIKILSDGIAKFPAMYEVMGYIRTHTSRADNIEQLKNIENAAKIYENALKGFIVVLQEMETEGALRIKIAADV